MEAPLPPPPDDLVSRLDAGLNAATMLRRFGTGAAPVVLRHWHIERRLGRGGMGAVYLGIDQQLHREVALKLVSHGPDDRSTNARVRDEARALAAIDHPNVVKVLHVYLDDDGPIIEMEFVRGADLRAWRSAAVRTWRDIVAVFAQVGAGVAAIHRAGLIHRDIKPGNLLIADNGVVRIVDLGLAQPVRVRSELPESPSVADLVAGTFGYIAPEVFVGVEPDSRSDQFSFCVALYEALFGVRPFHGDTPAELAQAMGTGRLTHPPSAPALPEWLRTAIVRGLQCDREKRHASMDDLVAVLHRGLARRPTWARRGGLTGVACGVFGLGLLLRPLPHDPCAAADEPLPVASRLDTLRAHVGPDPTPASRGLEVLGNVLEDRERVWASERGQLCRAPRIHRDPTVILDQWRCIDQRQAQLQAILARAANNHASPADILDATAAIEQLPACPDLEQATRPAPEREPWLVERLAAAARHEDAGNYGEAERLARDAVAGARDSPRLPEALYRLGHILGAQDRSTAALNELERAENLASEQHSDELACQILAYRVKLRAASELSVADGERDLGRANSCIHRTRAQAPLLLADMLEARGLVAYAARDYYLAISHHQHALYLRRTHLGELHIDVSKSLHNLGNTLEESGLLVPALRHLEAALVLRRQLLGADHPRLADILHDLGHLYATLELPGQARQLYEEATAIIRAAGTPRAPILADLEMSLAHLDLAEGDLDAAGDHLRKAHQLQAIDLDLASSHPQRALRLHLEATAHAQRGNHRAALPLLKEATRLLRDHAENDEVLASLVNEIESRYAVGDLPGLAALAHDLGPRLLRALREREIEASRTLAWYVGDSLRNQGSPSAVPYLALALAGYRDHGAAREMLQLQQELSLAQRPRSTPRATTQ